jgi:hypothetical protein
MSEWITWETPTTDNYSKNFGYYGGIDKTYFYSSPTFRGEHKGFVFTTGRNGTGYYIENYEKLTENE